MKAPTESAETLALEAVAFLFQDEERIERFFNASGLEPNDVRARLTDPALLAAVCAFLLTDDVLVLDFCQGRQCLPEDLHRAQHRLEQGEDRLR